MTPDAPNPPPPPSLPGPTGVAATGSNVVPPSVVREVAAGEATALEAAHVRRLASTDPALAERLARAEALEQTLRSDALLPLPLGLVTRILDHVERGIAGDDGSETRADPTGEGARVRVPAPGSRSPRAWVAIAAGAVLALGAGIGGLWTVAGSGDLYALVGATTEANATTAASPVATLVSLADEARTSTRGAVTSLVSVPDRLPGSPAVLGLGAVTLLGAAVVGARRTGGSRPAGIRTKGPSRKGPSPESPSPGSTGRSEGSES